jgi:hypothetical protein
MRPSMSAIGTFRSLSAGSWMGRQTVVGSLLFAEQTICEVTQCGFRVGGATATVASVKMFGNLLVA